MPNPPKFDPARRNPRIGPQTLPAEGRQGRAPRWPLPGRMRAGEQEAWRELWKTPQAVAWERMGQGVYRYVARYVRVSVEANETLDKGLLAEARLMETDLGLSPKAMRLMLWQIVGEAPKPTGGTRKEKPQNSQGATVTSIRDRIPAVDAGG